MAVNAKIDRKRASPARVLPTNLDVASERFDAEGLAVGHQGVASRTSGDGLQVVADDEAVADAEVEDEKVVAFESLGAVFDGAIPFPASADLSQFHDLVS